MLAQTYKLPEFCIMWEAKTLIYPEQALEMWQHKERSGSYSIVLHTEM